MVYDDIHGIANQGNMTPVRSAVEMAVVPHNLVRGGQYAHEPNGNKWAWSNRLGQWVLFEVGNENGKEE